MKDFYLSRYQENRDSLPGSEMVKKQREEAMKVFTDLPFPHVRSEEWRHTSLKSHEKREFPPLLREHRSVSIADLEHLSIPGFDSYRIVFINGFFAPEFSSLPQDGVEVAPVRELLTTEAPEELFYLPEEERENFFLQLNTALFEDGLYVRVKKGEQPDKPLNLVFLNRTGGVESSFHPRNLFIIESGASLELVERYYGPSLCPYLMNPFTSFVLKEEASVTHCCIVDEGKNSLHLGHTVIQLAEKSRFYSSSFLLKGAITRRETGVGIAKRSECLLNGLALGREDALRDFYLRVSHDEPEGKSLQNFKGIYHDTAQGVFNGKIVVQKGAQKTVAHQTTKNLLLSDDCVANARPQLEIYADDVQCTHGATAGHLDDEALFYLKSRGIPEEEARDMLTAGFTRDLLDSLQWEAVKTHLERLLAL